MSSAVEPEQVEPESPAEARRRAAAAMARLTERSRAATKAVAHVTTTRLAPWLARTGKTTGLHAQRTYAATRDLSVKSGRAALAGSRTAATSSWRFMAGTAAPWIARTALRTRDRLRPSVLHEDFRGMLLFLHQRVADRDVESVLFVPTREPLPFKRHRIVNLRRLAGEAARATPARIVNWALAAIPEPLARFTFVEFGAGRGRTLLLASGWPFEKVIGIEPDARLHNDCQMNIAQYPRSRMKCRDVECLLDDVLTAPLPAHETVFFLFQPVDERTLAELMGRIAESYRAAPRRLYFVCVGVNNRAPIEASGIFQKIQPGHGLRLKAALLSPFPIAVYRSIA